MMQITIYGVFATFVSEVKSSIIPKKDDFKLNYFVYRDLVKSSQASLYSMYFLNLIFIVPVLTIFGLLVSTEASIAIIMTLSIIYILRLLKKSPYLNHIHNKAIIYNNFILVFHSIVLMVDCLNDIS